MTHSIIVTSGPKEQKDLAKATRTFLANYLSPNTQKAYLADFVACGTFLSDNFPNIREPNDITMDHWSCPYLNGQFLG